MTHKYMHFALVQHALCCLQFVWLVVSCATIDTIKCRFRLMQFALNHGVRLFYVACDLHNFIKWMVLIHLRFEVFLFSIVGCQCTCMFVLHGSSSVIK
jgi:hypothetical protein